MKKSATKTRFKTFVLFLIALACLMLATCDLIGIDYRIDPRDELADSEMLVFETGDPIYEADLLAGKWESYLAYDWDFYERRWLQLFGDRSGTFTSAGDTGMMTFANGEHTTWSVDESAHTVTLAMEGTSETYDYSFRSDALRPGRYVLTLTMSGEDPYGVFGGKYLYKGDIDRLRTITDYPLPSSVLPWAMTVFDGYLWVLVSDSTGTVVSIYKIDPADGSIAATIALPTEVVLREAHPYKYLWSYGIAFRGADLFIADMGHRGQFTQIDPATGAVVGAIPKGNTLACAGFSFTVSGIVAVQGDMFKHAAYMMDPLVVITYDAAGLEVSRLPEGAHAQSGGYYGFFYVNETSFHGGFSLKDGRLWGYVSAALDSICVAPLHPPTGYSAIGMTGTGPVQLRYFDMDVDTVRAVAWESEKVWILTETSLISTRRVDRL